MMKGLWGTTVDCPARPLCRHHCQHSQLDCDDTISYFIFYVMRCVSFVIAPTFFIIFFLPLLLLFRGNSFLCTDGVLRNFVFLYWLLGMWCAVGEQRTLGKQ